MRDWWFQSRGSAVVSWTRSDSGHTDACNQKNSGKVKRQARARRPKGNVHSPTATLHSPASLHRPQFPPTSPTLHKNQNPPRRRTRRLLLQHLGRERGDETPVALSLMTTMPETTATKSDPPANSHSFPPRAYEVTTTIYPTQTTHTLPSTRVHAVCTPPTPSADSLSPSLSPMTLLRGYLALPLPTSPALALITHTGRTIVFHLPPCRAS